MSFKILWNLASKGLSSHLKSTSWSPRWTHRLKRYRASGIASHSKKVNNSQWFLRTLRGYFDRYGRKAIVLSATGVYNSSRDKTIPFTWPECDIDDGTLQELTVEMNEMDSLKMATIVCSICKKRLVIDKIHPGKVYCSCANNKAVIDPVSKWQPFLEDKDIIIWRREQEGGDGLFAYKVYGRYNEVCAEDFLMMHIDTDYWQTWDSSALSVRTLDMKYDNIGGQCVIHWEMLWPRFFSNRDYVYVRRYAYLNGNPQYSDRGCKKLYESEEIDHNGKQIKKSDSVIVITSRSCNHPEVPETKTAYRIKKYWSNLVIRPYTFSDQPGIEFSLTYFDDPGANLPSSLQAWVAGQGMPEFLGKMRKAAAVYKKATKDQKRKEYTIPKKLSNVPPVPIPNVIYNLQNKTENSLDEKINLQSSNPTQEFLNLLYEKPANESSSETNIDILKTQKNTADKVIDVQSLPVEEFKEKELDQKLPDAQQNEKSHVLEGGMRNQEDSSMTFTKNNTSDETPAVHHQENSSDGQDKPVNQNQNNSYSYWHFWPLYYFA